MKIDAPLISRVETGTAPITVESSTLCTGVNVEKLNGQLGSFYTNAGNLTGTLPNAIAGDYQLKTEKDAANGYAGLDASARLVAARMPAYSGDASSSAGATVLTLATVNSTVGTFNSPLAITVNAKGLVTSVVENASALILSDDWQTGQTTGLLGWDIDTGGTAITWSAAQQTTTIRGVIDCNIKKGNQNNRITLTLYNAGLPFLASRGLKFATKIKLEALGDGTNPYRVRLGMGDIIPGNSATDQNNGFYFEYDYAQSANWRCKTAAAGARTTSTTSTAVVAGTWITLSAQVNATNTAILFYIDGSLVATISSNLPTELGNDFSPLLSGTRFSVNGTLDRHLYVDSYTAQFTS